MKLTLLQLHNLSDNELNMAHAIEKINSAAEKSDIVVLPEMFSCPYKNSAFPLFAQEDGGTNWERLSECARKNKIYIVAGSMPELEITREDCRHVERIFNTCYVFDRSGNQIAKHRKVHLFDCDYKNGVHFHESDTLSSGNEITLFDTEFGRIGVMICFDIRFPEFSRLYADSGASLVICPAAFNQTSGPKYWNLMFRTRAVDNQIFFAGCSPSFDEKASYKAYGHSIVANPFGEVLGELDEKEGELNVEIDLGEIAGFRAQSPIVKSLKRDLYKKIADKCVMELSVEK
ncbi:MAG: carbon-nitrogen hydrolase family protein [Treponema sp.]|nr:carbon-nitrogen hydrolase family protein [Treponema sp.]